MEAQFRVCFWVTPKAEDEHISGFWAGKVYFSGLLQKEEPPPLWPKLLEQYLRVGRRGQPLRRAEPQPSLTPLDPAQPSWVWSSPSLKSNHLLPVSSVESALLQPSETPCGYAQESGDAARPMRPPPRGPPNPGRQDKEEDLSLQRGALGMSEASSCPGSETPAPGCRPGTLYWACAHNDAVQLQALLDGGVSPEEATQVDSNGRTGLMVACYLGFESIVTLLSHCPFLNVNQQDKEGDTALMLAAQAGHVPLVGLLLNYYSGLDLERRDQRGLTALMKAAMRNRSDCVTALLMAGADLTVVDPVRGKTALEWAVLTNSFDTVRRIRQLQRRPCVEQLGRHFQPRRPALSGLMVQNQATAAPSLLERLLATLSLSFVQSPQEGGVLDHLVTTTTSLASPFLTTACHTLCPDHPPALGTRSKSVPELLGTSPPPPPAPQTPKVVPGTLVLSPCWSPQRMWGMCPQHLQPRDSTTPRPRAPKIILSRMPSLPRQCLQEPKSAGYCSLALPVWRYQEVKMERRRQEEEARKAQNKGKKS